MAIEQASYQTIIKNGNFELRLYDPMIVALSQERDIKGSSGFNHLFNYISGNNQESRKIAMTAPVINNLGDEDLTIAFVMPKEFRLEELPQPAHPEIRIKELPRRYVAAISFSGNINPALIEKKKSELIKDSTPKRVFMLKQ